MVIACIPSFSESQPCTPSRRPYTSCRGTRRRTAHRVSWWFSKIQKHPKHTFVFFIRHLSQAFHTRLCLPSADDDVWEWESVVAGDAGWPWVLARLETRCTALTAFECECCLLGPWDLRISSLGGVGKLSMVAGFCDVGGADVCVSPRVSRCWCGRWCLAVGGVCKWSRQAAGLERGLGTAYSFSSRQTKVNKGA